jgi:hypothetical protein
MRQVITAKPRFSSESQRTKKPSRKRAPAKQPLFAHIRHTGRMLSYKHTSYSLIVLLLFMVGVVMCLNSALATADITTSDSYVVHGKILGVAPTSPAVITSPVEGTIFSEQLIPVSGTCPQSATYVKLYRNNLFAGVALCHEGTFSLQASLVLGKNTFKLEVFNISDLQGPDSRPLSVYYGTGPEGVSSTVNNGNVGAPAPLNINADYSYRGYYINQELTWTMGIAGGVGPFITHVDWGDNTDSIQKQDGDGPLTLTHIYTRHGGDRMTYIIKITVTDAAGQAAFLQLATLIAVPGVNGFGIVTGSSTPSGPGLSSLQHTITRIAKYAWPTYLVTVIMVVSFWLGEHREFIILQGRFRFVKRLRRLS